MITIENNSISKLENAIADPKLVTELYQELKNNNINANVHIYFDYVNNQFTISPKKNSLVIIMSAGNLELYYLESKQDLIDYLLKSLSEINEKLISYNDPSTSADIAYRYLPYDLFNENSLSIHLGYTFANGLFTIFDYLNIVDLEFLDPLKTADIIIENHTSNSLNDFLEHIILSLFEKEVSENNKKWFNELLMHIIKNEKSNIKKLVAINQLLTLINTDELLDILDEKNIKYRIVKSDQ